MNLEETDMSLIYYSDHCSRIDFVHRILGIFNKQLDNTKRIFIKPNIVSSEPYPTTTHPELLDALLYSLSEKEVIVGDAPAVDAGRSDKVLMNTPLREVCENHKVSLVNLYSKPTKTVKSRRGYKIKVSTVPFSCDFVISVPVLKAHNMCGLSGALKNQFGYLSRTDRILMHTKLKDIHKGIAEVNVAIPTNLFIIDAIQTMVKAQEHRHGGSACELGVMMAGTDPVSLDCLGLDLLSKLELGIAAKRASMKYIDYASEYSVGSKDYRIKKIL